MSLFGPFMPESIQIAGDKDTQKMRRVTCPALPRNNGIRAGFCPVVILFRFVAGRISCGGYKGPNDCEPSMYDFVLCAGIERRSH